MTTKSRKKAPAKLLKLDLGAGQNPREGYEGVDIWDGADYTWDLNNYPWPFADNSVEAIHTSHYVEHIPMVTIDGRDALCRFMDECWRILIPGGEMSIIHPYAMSTRAFQDPTHRRFIPEATWLYFNREWRELNKLDHYGIECDFDNVVTQGLGIPDDVSLRSDEAQMFARTRYWNVIADLSVTLKARGE